MTQQKKQTKQESRDFINILLQNSEDQELLNETINKNIDKIGQNFFDVLEEAVENAQYENQDESAEFLVNYPIPKEDWASCFIMP